MGDLFNYTNDYLCRDLKKIRIQVPNNLENAYIGYYKNPTRKALPTMMVLDKVRQECSNMYKWV